MIEDAENAGLLRPHTGSRIFEGTVGSTGISIATIAKARWGFHVAWSCIPLIACLEEDMKLVSLDFSEHSFRYAQTSPAIVMPDDVAEEKVKALIVLGADVERVRPASIVDNKQV